MNFRIPFTLASLEKLIRSSQPFSIFVSKRKDAKLQKQLENASIPITREQYLSIVARSTVWTLITVYVASTTFLALTGVNRFYFLGLIIALLCSTFIFIIQRFYPTAYTNRRQRNIERNLIPALDDIMVQLNSGIPLFNILVNISSSDYGELSVEFKKAVKKINAGLPEVEVLDDLGKKNNSLFLRRTLWQISNGMKAGSDISIVVKESIKALNEEQFLQIQTYGNKLNPLIMFYMLISVIVPALSVTFLTIISSLINLPRTMTFALFGGLFIMVIIIQLTFIGLIRSTRPSLL